jgi:hypothetical protein
MKLPIKKMLAVLLFSTLAAAPLCAQTNAMIQGETNNASTVSTNVAPELTVTGSSGASVRINGAGIHVADANPAAADVPTGWHRERGIDVIGIVAIVATFSTPIVIIAIFFYFRHRRNQILHETVRMMVEKGVPIPPELFSKSSEGTNAAKHPRNDFRSGLILTGVGIGVIMLAGKAGWIILLVGVAFLIASLAENRSKNDVQPPKS